jgi:hypothetical protein
MRPDTDLAATMPHNIEAERAILGAVLLDNRALNTAIGTLIPTDFFHDHHRRIYRQMITLADGQQPIDLLTLAEQLRRCGDLESAGGDAYVAQLIDGVPNVTNVEHYARIVKDRALLRSLILTSNSIQQQAFAANDNASLILDRAKHSIESLGTLNGLSAEPARWRDMFHTFEDFENTPPLSFAIEGFLQNNGATMIGGLSGHGKTLILLSVVKALLAGKGTRLWDLFDVQETAIRVLYLIPECAIQAFKHRLQLFGIYHALAPNDNRLLVHTLSKGPTPCLSDPRILYAAKGAHVFLDTAVRFGTDDENSATDNQRGLASDIFALLQAGARSVTGAHHSPKPFARENVMRLENVLRGSGDIGAMLTTAWGIKPINAAQNIIHIENIKPRDFQPCGPFQIIGRPDIDDLGDFSLHKEPGQCGALQEEQEPQRDKGGARIEARKERERRIRMARDWLSKDPNLSIEELHKHFESAGIQVSESAVKNYRRGALNE